MQVCILYADLTRPERLLGNALGVLHCHEGACVPPHCARRHPRVSERSVWKTTVWQEVGKGGSPRGRCAAGSRGALTQHCCLDNQSKRR
jgi:hypothetical protein